MEDNEKIRLIVDPETRAVLDKRRLRDEDIRKTIAVAEETGEKFVHPESGHFLAGVRQDKVTIWVEFSPREDGYKIITAYQHRVLIRAWDLRTGKAR